MSIGRLQDIIPHESATHSLHSRRMSDVNHPTTSDPEGIGSTQSSTGGDESFFRYLHLGPMDVCTLVAPILTCGSYNEERRLSERYLRFNVDEHKRAAVEYWSCELNLYHVV